MIFGLSIWLTVALSVVLLFGLLFISIFLDFIKDAWKVPFAMLVDLLDIYALFNPGLADIGSAVGSLLVFFILGRSYLRFPGGVIAGAEGLLNVGSFGTPIFAGQITGLLPINTILMIIDCIMD